MSNKPLFQHRHYCKIAEIINNLAPDVRDRVADHFAINLRHQSAQQQSALQRGALPRCRSGQSIRPR